MFLTAAITIGGAVLLGLAARRDEKNPFQVLGGLACLGVALFLHATSPAPWVQSAGFAAAELGAGMLVVAGLLSKRRDEARNFFFIGAGAMTLGVLLILGKGFFTSYTTILVELGPDDTWDEIAAVVEEHQGVGERAFPMVDLSEDEDLAQVYIIRLPEKCREALRKILDMDWENVDNVEANIAMGIDLPAVSDSEALFREDVLENDPLVASQWGLDAIRGHEAHALLENLEPQRKAIVAIVDTGVDAVHEDMKGIFDTSPGNTDRHGHGTHCAGIAGAATNNGLGVASLNWEGRFVQIRSYSALGDNGMGTLESISEALIAAAEDGADVISMSLGGQSPIIPKTIKDAVRYARAQGAVIVVAAGNSNMDASNNVPSNVDGVIAVGAVNEQLNKAPFSNTTQRLTRPIAAPGTNVLSLKPTGGYVKLSGTSMATPMVAGLLGVMRSIDPSIDADALYDMLKSTGRTVGGTRTVGQMIDAEAAIKAVVDA